MTDDATDSPTLRQGDDRTPPQAQRGRTGSDGQSHPAKPVPKARAFYD